MSVTIKRTTLLLTHFAPKSTMTTSYYLRLTRHFILNSFKMISICIVWLMTSSCAKVELKGQSEELSSYIAELKNEYTAITGEQLHTNIPINIKDLSQGKKAFCRKTKGMAYSSREIFIDRKIYEYFKDRPDQIKTILLHEIGHCVYNLKHDLSLITIDKLTVPKSVMYPEIITVLDNPFKIIYYQDFRDRVFMRNQFIPNTPKFY